MTIDRASSGPKFRLAVMLWILAGVGLLVWSRLIVQPVGWDLNVYKAAVISLRAGHDPYADAMAVQRAFHDAGPHPPMTPVPFSYVYSPMTLPLLRLVARIPLWVTGVVYWLLYAAAVAVVIRVSLWASRDGSEGGLFVLLTPLALFFPGLLLHNVIFSGNIAYILYGLIFAGAYWGWTRGRWTGFYVAVVLASCFKAPMLFLLAIPVLSARGEWVKTGVAAAVGVALFAVQPAIWPALFHNYLTAVELQFSYNRDFSASPAGLSADALYDAVPYKITTVAMYAVCVALFGWMLLYLRRKYLAGALTLKEWVPVMMVGVALLNLRIMEYDVAALPLLMALVMWRVFARKASRVRAVVGMSVFFVAIQALGVWSWRPGECIVLVCVFAAGFCNLALVARDAERGLEKLGAA